MHHPLRHIHPALLSPPSSFPPSSFSQGATSHALGKQTSTEQLQKTSMKSKLFGTPPPTQAPQLMPHPPNRTLQHAPHPHRHIHPALLSPPSSFPLSSFFSRRHFPCSWQADINRAASKTFNEKQTLWHSPSHTGTPTHAPTRYPKTGLQHAPHPHRYIHPPSCIIHPTCFQRAPLKGLHLPKPLANRYQHSHFKNFQDRASPAQKRTV